MRTPVQYEVQATGKLRRDCTRAQVSHSNKHGQDSVEHRTGRLHPQHSTMSDERVATTKHVEKGQSTLMHDVEA